MRPNGRPVPNPERIRVLVVSDFDLPSAARLAESSLLASTTPQRRRDDERPIDLCIAVNPSNSCCQTTIDPYYSGSQKRNRILKSYRCSRNSSSSNNNNNSNVFCHGVSVDQLRGRAHARRLPGLPSPPHSFRSVPIPVPLPQVHQPRFHPVEGDSEVLEHELEDDPEPKHHSCTCAVTPEENAAKLGILTASLAQLESIVCRVVYMLGGTESDSGERTRRRLTSNSLDIRNTWVPLLGGLGIGGVDESSHTDESILRLAFPWSSSPKDEETDPIRFQSILVRNCDNSVSSAGEGSNPSSFIAQHCLLEIANGPQSHGDSLGTSRNEKASSAPRVVVQPGSLQERGEFCILDLVVKTLDKEGTTTDSERDWQWEIERIRSCRLGDNFE